MALVDGTHVTPVMYKQMQTIGEKRAKVRALLKRLGAGGNPKSVKLSPAQAALVRKASRVSTNIRNMLAAPYDADGFSVFYYRTGNDHDSADVLEDFRAKFKAGGTDHANAWCLLLGRFDSGTLVEPAHDNTPEMAGNPGLSKMESA